jgi:myotubularin-related protein 6/7/8
MNVFGPQVLPSLTPQTSNASGGRSGTSTPNLQQEPVVTGTETAEKATGAGTTSDLPPTHAIGERANSVPNNPSPFDAAAALGQDLKQNFVASIERLGIGSPSAFGGARGASPASAHGRLSTEGGRERGRLSADLTPQNAKDRSRSRGKEIRDEVEVEMQ